MIVDKSCTSAQNETTFSDSNYSFCHREVLNIDKILSENIQSLNSLSNSIISTRPICVINDGSNYFEETNGIVAKVRSFMQQEGNKKETLSNKSIQKEIKQLKEDIERVSQEIDKLQAKEEHTKSLGVFYGKALNYYTTNFDIKIEVDSTVDENKFWVKLHFGDKPQFPLKFLINHKTDTVEDFDSLTLLSPEEEAALKNKYYEEHDICLILKLLRNLALNKS